MLISLEYKFIFVANLKTASTAIEHYLYQFSQIRLCRSEWGKHMGINEIENRFDWLFNSHSIQEFTVFGVIRDPLDYLTSLYLSHTHKKFQNSPQLYTGDLSFEQFLYLWCNIHKTQTQPQYKRFVKNNGEFGLNYLISYSKFEEQFKELLEKTNIPTKNGLENLNVSPNKNREILIEDKHLMLIKDKYKKDYELLQNKTGFFHF